MKKTFEFTLILEGMEEITETLEDALYKAGCSDALLMSRNGAVFLDFAREARSMRDAVTSAIHDIERHVEGVKVAGIAQSPIVTQSMIAERLGVSREAVRLWIENRRGDGAFPAPVMTSGKNTSYWDWLDVLNWRKAQGAAPTAEQAEIASALTEISLALQLRRHADHVPQILQTLGKLASPFRC